MHARTQPKTTVACAEMASSTPAVRSNWYTGDNDSDAQEVVDSTLATTKHKTKYAHAFL